ncbi:HNH endonuclease [Bordetella petrii]|uniref:HNH endonuclease n=1 Tax=Bordetella petrii TaxID=94624 RepID=UPI001A9722E0|nr:hypothetical protein [Bordetella petrii]MBO1112584.1 hypothetical protein [Bordetella petrii]
MDYSTIKHHLKPYGIVARRKTTINHAFAAAIAPNDEYSVDRVRTAMIDLGQDPENLQCAYCGTHAETWDHVFATVKASNFSGHGHRLGNLLPCCKPCNSAKGNKHWRSYIEKLSLPNSAEQRVRIEAYLEKYGVVDDLPQKSAQYLRLLEIKKEVMALLKEADELATLVRGQSI